MHYDNAPSKKQRYEQSDNTIHPSSTEPNLCNSGGTKAGRASDSGDPASSAKTGSTGSTGSTQSLPRARFQARPWRSQKVTVPT